MRKYGKEPRIVGQCEVDCDEMLFYLYLPIKLADTLNWQIPPRLSKFGKLIEASRQDAQRYFGTNFIVNRYAYLTAKTLFVTPDAPGNRPGWHADGFGSGGDINYIWSDCNPTEFAVQQFPEISSDDSQSIIDMTKYVDEDEVVTYADNTLLRLDEDVIHRVGPVERTGVRTFFKMTFSKHQFRMRGNSRNYLLDYDWEMNQRADGRNLDSPTHKIK